MQKWEYIEVRISGPEWADSRGNLGKLEDMRIRSTRWYSMAHFMNEQGEEGWELAGIADDESLNSFVMYFKRPKS